jgi:hypothetical protein
MIRNRPPSVAGQKNPTATSTTRARARIRSLLLNAWSRGSVDAKRARSLVCVARCLYPGPLLLANTGGLRNLSSLARVSLIVTLVSWVNSAEADTAGPPRWEEVLSADEVSVVRNRRALPRAWFVGQVRSVSAKEALKHVRGETPRPFDPRTTALVEVPAEELPPVDAASMVGARLRVRDQRPGRYVFETELTAPGFLVLSESYFPGWVARVDDRSARVYQADYVVMGVGVPAGRHTVELSYQPRVALRGVVISLTAVFLILGLGLYARNESKRTATKPSSSRELPNER